MTEARVPVSGHVRWLLGGGVSILLVVIVGFAAWFSDLLHPDPRILQGLIDARFGAAPWITAEALSTRMQSAEAADLVLLDVRDPSEFAVSHLPGARRVEPGLLLTDELRAADIVVYCSVGYRSAAVALELRAAGAGRVANLLGGVFHWANEGRPLVRGHERTEKVHPYNGIWSRFVTPIHRAVRSDDGDLDEGR